MKYLKYFEHIDIDPFEEEDWEDEEGGQEPLNFSDEFKRFLESSDSIIANDLLDRQGNGSKIDFADKDNLIKVNNKPIKIGKFIKKTFNYVDNDFIEEYKTYVGYKTAKFEISKGDDIIYWYNRDNNEEAIGILSMSVMGYPQHRNDLRLYADNDNISILLLKGLNDDTKIRGRAILWKLSDGRMYVDRQYTNRDYEINLFRMYAEENGWLIYRHNQPIAELLEVDNIVNNGDYDPYMDTFKYRNGNTLTNHEV